MRLWMGVSVLAVMAGSFVGCTSLNRSSQVLGECQGYRSDDPAYQACLDRARKSRASQWEWEDGEAADRERERSSAEADRLMEAACRAVGLQWKLSTTGLGTSGLCLDPLDPEERARWFEEEIVQLNQTPRSSGDIPADLLRFQGGWCLLGGSADPAESRMVLEAKRDTSLGNVLYEGRLFPSGIGYIQYRTKAEGLHTFDLTVSTDVGIGTILREWSLKLDAIRLESSTLTTVTNGGEQREWRRCESGV